MSKKIRFLYSICAIFSIYFDTNASFADPFSGFQETIKNSHECVHFDWLPVDVKHPKGAISIPVSVNGIPFKFQLDTGTNTDIIYGRISEDNKWSKYNEKKFRLAKISIGNTFVENPVFLKWPDEKPDETSGEIGLADLISRVSVIDYPDRLFCLYQRGELPDSMRSSARWTEASLSQGKLFVRASVGGVQLKNMIFDSGSSLFPLWVDLATWKATTDDKKIISLKDKITVNHFADKITYSGYPSSRIIKIGDIPMGTGMIYTQDGTPKEFSRWEYKVDGIIGNALFFNKILLIDLADDHTKIGIIGN